MGFSGLDSSSQLQPVSFALSNVLDAKSPAIKCARTCVTRPATLRRRPDDCPAPCRVVVATSQRDSGHSCPGQHKRKVFRLPRPVHGLDLGCEGGGNKRNGQARKRSLKFFHSAKTILLPLCTTLPNTVCGEQDAV